MKHYAMPDCNTVAPVVVLADGEYPGDGIPAAILAKASRVVCCDGAADTFTAHGGKPYAIVGDGDSVSEATRARFSGILFLSSEQESNDLTKACRFCTEHGMNEITILGATGRREDHTIGNISLLADYVRTAETRIVTPTGVFNAIHGPASFSSCPRQQVSIITIGTTTKVRVKNLKYTPPADGLCSWWRGTLNEAKGDCFEIYTDGPTIIFRAFVAEQ